MKTQKLRDTCADIFAGATIFTNDNISRDYKNGGYRVIRLADIQNNKIFSRIVCFIAPKTTSKTDTFCKITIFYYRPAGLFLRLRFLMKILIKQFLLLDLYQIKS